MVVPGPTWLASKLSWMGTWAWPGDTLSRAKTQPISSLCSMVEDGAAGQLPWPLLPSLYDPQMPWGGWAAGLGPSPLRLGSDRVAPCGSLALASTEPRPPRWRFPLRLQILQCRENFGRLSGMSAPCSQLRHTSQSPSSRKPAKKLTITSEPRNSGWSARAGYWWAGCSGCCSLGAGRARGRAWNLVGRETVLRGPGVTLVPGVW